MKYKIKKVVVTEEQNELGSILVERLIEKLLLEELNLSLTHKATIISEQWRVKNVKEKFPE